MLTTHDSPSILSDASRRTRRRIFRKLGLAPYLEHRELFQVGDLPIHCELYRYAKSAPTILFLPGIGTYSELYCEFLSGLSRLGFNVIGVDLRGHGYSGGRRGEYSIQQVVADISLVLDAVEEELTGPIGLFGCSIGARLGLAAAEADPRIRSLICHTLFLAELPPDLVHLIGWSTLPMSVFCLPDIKVNFRTFVDVDALLRHNPLGDYIDQDELLVWNYPLQTLNSVFNAPSQAYYRQQPFASAILIGGQDEVLSPFYMKQLIALASHPFDYLEVPGASHMLPFDHIQETQQHCRTWFNRTLLGQ